MSEWQFIDWIRSRTDAAHKSGPKVDPVILGPGDDAGIVTLQPETIAAVDMLMDGVHFELDKIDPALAGRKALAVNLSDIAAMGARPVCALISLALPAKGGLNVGQKMMEGIMKLADEFDVSILGGDTNSWSGPAVISVTVLGEPLPGRPTIKRSGARAGDWVLVTGNLGGSLGSKRHLTFTPRVKEAAFLNTHFELTSMIDLSDGLATDASHIAHESHVAIRLDPAGIPVSPDTQNGSAAQRLAHAMTDGEDFELMFTAAPEVAREILGKQPLAGVRVTHIGECVAGNPQLTWRDGTVIEPRGFEHFLD
ncbi:thiamine-monophosphate kinase [bacterium]|nr:thiamine-monophosphate kinase [bacterium]